MPSFSILCQPDPCRRTEKLPCGEKRDNKWGREGNIFLSLMVSAQPQQTTPVARCWSSFGVCINVWCWIVVHRTFSYLRIRGVRGKAMGLDKEFIQGQGKKSFFRVRGRMKFVPLFVSLLYLCYICFFMGSVYWSVDFGKRTFWISFSVVYWQRGLG